MPLVKNQIIPLTIDALSSDGNGVGRFEGHGRFCPVCRRGRRAFRQGGKNLQKLRLWHRRKRPHARHRAHPCGLPYFRPVRRLLFPAPFLPKQSLRQSKASWRTPCAASAGWMCPCGTSFPLHRPSATGTRCSILCFSLGTAVFKPAFMRAAAIGRCLAGTVCSSPDC